VVQSEGLWPRKEAGLNRAGVHMGKAQEALMEPLEGRGHSSLGQPLISSELRPRKAETKVQDLFQDFVTMWSSGHSWGALGASVANHGALLEESLSKGSSHLGAPLSHT
jgi:hypothetical protein